MIEPVGRPQRHYGLADSIVPQRFSSLRPEHLLDVMFETHYHGFIRQAVSEM